MKLKMSEEAQFRPPLSASHTFVLPRGLSRLESARYIGVSASLFDRMVQDGRMPKPKRINSRTVWDRHQLDSCFDALPEIGAEPDDHNPWDGIPETYGTNPSNSRNRM